MYGLVDHGIAIVEGELPIDPDAQFLPILPELPRIKAAGILVAHIDADVPNQILRTLGMLGVATATRRQSGPIRTAIMSFSTLSPGRTPASKPSSTMLRNMLSRISSTQISDNSCRFRWVIVRCGVC
jgi:hypothetical protein